MKKLFKHIEAKGYRVVWLSPLSKSMMLFNTNKQRYMLYEY